MAYINTRSGKRFDPAHPVWDDIDVSDIAHAMSMLCRANGHLREFFSVARHCVNCANEAKARGLSEKIQLACLLHDAAEAYLGDLTRPVKEHLPRFRSFEENLQNAIYQKFIGAKITVEESRKVKDIDDAMLFFEFLYFMGGRLPVEGARHPVDAGLFPPFLRAGQGGLSACFLSLAASRCLCVGVDICSKAWVAAALRGEAIAVERFFSIAQLCERFGDADIILIDIPIGLPECKEQKTFRPDGEVQRLLKGRACTVFPTPCRQAVYAESYAEAARLQERFRNDGLPAQSYGIARNIRDVDMFLAPHPAWRERLLESHPEYCFFRLNGNRVIQEGEKSEEGTRKRAAVLEGYVAGAAEAVRRSGLPAHDVLDALCLAVTGRLILQRGMVSLPDRPRPDSRGLPMPWRRQKTLNAAVSFEAPSQAACPSPARPPACPERGRAAPQDPRGPPPARRRSPP